MPFSAGETVGSYRVIEQLGQGGMATVYKAYHPFLERYVALKVLHPAFKEDPNFLARFQREAKVVAQLEHPNIVPVYDFAEHEGQPYLVMKYIEGETLKARLARGPLSKEEIIAILLAVGDGLAYAHKQGILHRDVKPSNVLLSFDGQIFLTDFGLARIASAGESTLSSDMILGTPQYISPEQALGKRDLDEGTDIYSFGVLLYEMLVGKVPFSADTPFAIIHDHIYTSLPLPRQLNPELSLQVEQALVKALEKNRVDRFTDMGEMVKVFQSALQQNYIEPTSITQTPVQTAVLPETDPGLKEAAPETVLVNETNDPISETRTKQIQSSPGVELPLSDRQDNASKAEHPAPKKNNTALIAGGIGLIILCVCAVVFMGWLRSSRLGAKKLTATGTVASVLATPGQLQDTQMISSGSLTGTENTSGTLLQNALDKVRLYPNDPTAHTELAFAYIASLRIDQSKKELQTVQSLAGEDPTFYTKTGDAYFQAKIWLMAAWAYLRVAKYSPQMSPDAIERLHESVYLAYKNPFAEDIIPPQTINAVDQLLAGVAQARFEIYNGTLDNAQLDLDKVFKIQNNLPEERLAQAEVYIANKQFLRARTLLDNINKNPDTPVWIKDQVGLFQSILKP